MPKGNGGNQAPPMGGLPPGLLDVNGQPNQALLNTFPTETCEKCGSEFKIIGTAIKMMSPVHPANPTGKPFPIVMQMPVCMKCIIKEALVDYFKESMGDKAARDTGVR